MQGREAILPAEVDMCSTRQQRHDALHMAVATAHQTKWGICEMEEERRGKEYRSSGKFRY